MARSPKIIIRVPSYLWDLEIVKVLEKVHNWLQGKPAKRLRKKITTHPRPRSYPRVAFAYPKTKLSQLQLRKEKKSAKVILSRRLAEIAATYNLHYNKFRVSGAKTRWGSCSARKNINLNWKLVLGPQQIMDYVICHELSHLVHMNHSRIFWAHVATMHPQYKESRKWLKLNGHKLNPSLPITSL